MKKYIAIQENIVLKIILSPGVPELDLENQSIHKR